MKTTPEDFLSALYQLQSQNKIKHAILLPPDETIYEVQLNTRQIQAPDYDTTRQPHRVLCLPCTSIELSGRLLIF